MQITNQTTNKTIIDHFPLQRQAWTQLDMEEDSVRRLPDLKNMHIKKPLKWLKNKENE